ncbi:conserved hypothetical protein [Thermotomaculum hydrothermale]|uniref:Phosphoesterase n=1 Tax=Thermotomaculum hydrothermale TaxID=981385 RepID=A0A7R6SZ35_9BACT|nr:metallophosphoesterase [Thermotomaculum hydrothermale]BBB32342.1 conserved hypothetical protein [Thermotomaculum hydrothermale]
MKVAIFSDTHDNLTLFKKGIDYCKKQGIFTIIHAGDIISPFTIRVFGDYSQFNFIGVFGNNDGEMRYLKKLYKTIYYPPHFFEINGKKIALTHNPETLDFDKTDTDIIIYGHTHEKDLRENNEKLIINPGEACGYLTGEPTFAILETDNLEVKILNISQI